MSTTTKTKWHIAGEEMVSCNCAWGCPCQFNALPTTGHCEGVVGIEIRTGVRDGVLLDGVRFVEIVCWPGAIHEGNGTRQWIIDDKTSPDQRNALIALQSGREGGAKFEIFAAVCPHTLDTVFAPITLEIDREPRTGRIRIPGIIACDVEPIKNPATGEEHRARIMLPHGFEFKEAEMGNSVRWEVIAPAPLGMRYQDTYAQLNAFDWSNA